MCRLCFTLLVDPIQYPRIPWLPGPPDIVGVRVTLYSTVDQWTLFNSDSNFHHLSHLPTILSLSSWLLLEAILWRSCGTSKNVPWAFTSSQHCQFSSPNTYVMTCSLYITLHFSLSWVTLELNKFQSCMFSMYALLIMEEITFTTQLLLHQHSNLLAQLRNHNLLSFPREI